MKLTASKLRGFLKRQPKNKEYHFFDNHNCLVCQWMIAQGYNNVSAGGKSTSADGIEIPIPSNIRSAIAGLPNTFTREQALNALKLK